MQISPRGAGSRENRTLPIEGQAIAWAGPRRQAFLASIAGTTLNSRSRQLLRCRSPGPRGRFAKRQAARVCFKSDNHPTIDRPKHVDRNHDTRVAYQVPAFSPFDLCSVRAACSDILPRRALSIPTRLQSLDMELGPFSLHFKSRELRSLSAKRRSRLEIEPMPIPGIALKEAGRDESEKEMEDPARAGPWVASQ